MSLEASQQGAGLGVQRVAAAGVLLPATGDRPGIAGTDGREFGVGEGGAALGAGGVRGVIGQQQGARGRSASPAGWAAPAATTRSTSCARRPLSWATAVPGSSTPALATSAPRIRRHGHPAQARPILRDALALAEDVAALAVAEAAEPSCGWPGAAHHAARLPRSTG